MVAKCWNCHTEFEVVSSAAGTSNPSTSTIENLLLANMFDGDRGGLVTMSVDTLIQEVAEIIVDYLEQQ